VSSIQPGSTELCTLEYPLTSTQITVCTVYRFQSHYRTFRLKTILCVSKKHPYNPYSPPHSHASAATSQICTRSRPPTTSGVPTWPMDGRSPAVGPCRAPSGSFGRIPTVEVSISANPILRARPGLRVTSCQHAKDSRVASDLLATALVASYNHLN
jgi:hypothetical protein